MKIDLIFIDQEAQRLTLIGDAHDTIEELMSIIEEVE